MMFEIEKGIWIKIDLETITEIRFIYYSSKRCKMSITNTDGTVTKHNVRADTRTKIESYLQTASNQGAQSCRKDANVQHLTRRNGSLSV